MDDKKLKEQYLKLKKDYEKIIHDATLTKYKILTKAYKTGKKLYGQRYSYLRLSYDFEIPYTTVKRIISLDKANKTTWDLINSEKITSFKVAQILNQHGSTYQDELINLTIDKKLTTYDIRNLRSKSLKDIKKQRLEIAVKKGFAREEAAYTALCTTLERLDTLLTLEVIYLPQNKHKIIKKQLKDIKIKLLEFEKELDKKNNS